MPPRIFYYCYSHQRPNGGQKHTYRHVDILRAHGFDAYVYHPQEEFRLSWFENDTRVIGPTEFDAVYQSQTDYVVVPEDLGARISAFAGRVVVFDKNAFHGFRALGGAEVRQYPCLSGRVVAVLAVSEHNTNVLRFAYPDIPLHHVVSEIRRDRFRFRRLDTKKRLVVSSMKEPEHLVSIYHMLRARGTAGHNDSHLFEWRFLKGQSETEVAALLGDALIFIQMSGVEGLPRLPREAMASGCLVAAYDSGPMRECIPSRCLFRHGDLLSMARFIEEVMRSFPDALEQWDATIRESAAIVDRYSITCQEASVLGAWRLILSEDGPRAQSTSLAVAEVPRQHQHDRLSVED